jgi:group I intron endonuclease
MVIYITTNLITGKKYIGKDIFNNPKYIGSGKILKRSIRKYGKHNFTKEIIDNANTKKELEQKEIFWIEKYNAVMDSNFYNIATGGNGGKLGDIVNKKRSISLMGHKVSEETKDKIRKKAIGRKATKETRQRMSDTQSKIEKNWLKKYTKGESNPRAKAVVQLTTTGEVVKVWEYAKKAIKELQLNATAITDCLKGRQKTAGGYMWETYQP